MTQLLAPTVLVVVVLVKGREVSKKLVEKISKSMSNVGGGGADVGGGGLRGRGGRRGCWGERIERKRD